MKEADLVKDIAMQTRVSQAAVRKMLRAFKTSVAKALEEGSDVPLSGLGKFKISKRKARKGRNPQTGAVIDIPEKKVATFKAGVKLKKQI